MTNSELPAGEARVVAIDWSGRRRDEQQRRAIWIGEAADGELRRLERGRTRVEVVDWLIAEAERDPNLVVGIDCAFSLPQWFMLNHGFSAQQLWASLAAESLTPAMTQLGLAAWMDAPEAPFWSKRKADAGIARGQEFRQTELEVRAAGAPAKSVFQLVGAGQVGRGSLYGMQALHLLSAAGFRIWPFDPPGVPMVVELYPRLLTGPVIKSDRTERELYLASVPMAPEFRRLAASREDAFDTAISTLGMAVSVDELTTLPELPTYRLEGKIWPADMRAFNAHARSHVSPGERSVANLGD